MPSAETRTSFKALVTSVVLPSKSPCSRCHPEIALRGCDPPALNTLARGTGGAGEPGALSRSADPSASRRSWVPV